MYAQIDPTWANQYLGGSGLQMRNYGCLVTAVAEALTIAGHSITPGQLCDNLNEVRGFLPDGRLIWAKVTEVYPEFHFRNSQNAETEIPLIFEQGVMGKYLHWVLIIRGKIIDPYEGKEGRPPNYYKTGVKRTCSITKTGQPAQEAPVSAPMPVPIPQSVLRGYTVVKGDSLSKIALKFYGNSRRWTQIQEANKNTIKNPNLIYPGQMIIIP